MRADLPGPGDAHPRRLTRQILPLEVERPASRPQTPSMPPGARFALEMAESALFKYAGLVERTDGHDHGDPDGRAGAP